MNLFHISTSIFVYCYSIFDIKVLTEDEMYIIFNNWKDLSACNMKLMQSLHLLKKNYSGEEDEKQLIGQILNENFLHMSASYLRFCRDQFRSAALLKIKCDTDEVFKEVYFVLIHLALQLRCYCWYLYQEQIYDKTNSENFYILKVKHINT